MITALHRKFWTRPRLFAIVVTFLILAVFVGANVHLIKVAFASRPDCVLQTSTEGVAALRAAKPSC